MSYSIMFYRYSYPTATISGTYGYINTTTSNGAANALIYGGLTYYIVTILVPIVVLGIIIGACCWSRYRRQQGVVVFQQPQPMMQQPQPMMQQPSHMMQQPTAPVYIQNPGYTNNKIIRGYHIMNKRLQQYYTGLPYHEQQGHNKQNQPYQEGLAVVQQPYPMMQQPTDPVYIQNPGYTYPVTQQGYTGQPYHEHPGYTYPIGYTGQPYHEQQCHDKQNQPYQEPRRNIDRTKPLDQSDYQ